MRSAKNKSLLSVCVPVCVLWGSSLYAQESQLGKVEFPTSGSEKAQAHFLRGLAALHSFWYEEAAEAFRESTKVEPDFAMGYWGEAMTHNHPLWSEQDIAAARQVLSKIKETPKLTRARASLPWRAQSALRRRRQANPRCSLFGSDGKDLSSLSGRSRRCRVLFAVVAGTGES